MGQKFGLKQTETDTNRQKRKEMDRLDRLDRAERGTQGTWKEGKRKSEQNNKGEGRRKKKRKYEVLQGDWGECVNVKKAEQNICVANANEKDVEIVAGMSENQK